MPQPSPDNIVAIEDKALDKESVIEMLGEDETENQETLELEDSSKKSTKDKTEESKGKEKETTPDTEEDEEGKEKELTLEDELETELEEPDPDKLELVEIPRRKEILAAFPELFKKFPGIEKAIYREQAYSQLLPTVEDAKTAVGKADLLDKYEKEIYSGSTESLLTTVKDNDKDAFAKVVDNYLPTLHKVDQAAYFHTIGNVIKHTIISMVRDSKSQNDEDLGNAASVLNQYIFGTKNFTPPENLSRDNVQDDTTKKKEEEHTAREKAFIEKQYTVARDTLGGKVDNIIKATIDKNIDPQDSMTDFVRRVAVRQVQEDLERMISGDTRFKAIYDKLWERAFDNDFNQESMDRIKAAYLSKAKTFLAPLIRKSRAEALKGLRKTADTNNDKKERDKKGPLPVGKTRSSATLASGKTNTSSGNKSQVPKGMSTLEYLNSDD